MGSNGFDHPLQDSGKGEGVSRSKKLKKDVEQNDVADTSIKVDYLSSEEDSSAGSFDEEENQGTSSSKQPSVLEIFKARDWSVSSLTRRGMDHCTTAPITAYNNSLNDDDEIIYSRSMTEKKNVPRHDLKLDRLSEREKVQNYLHLTSFMPLLAHKSPNS
ncbi:hypothetical protein Patl1_08060 [Pistacia atlantica]|uniref:Uncharacterized protein n=1 Tax=Pistacia atlantica TaxID=434234 RepID=A0ACC1AG63_9ROSI|nr:hypothetical protein Patl1_08060 [Pistacia atlantica]